MPLASPAKTAGLMSPRRAKRNEILMRIETMGELEIGYEIEAGFHGHVPGFSHPIREQNGSAHWSTGPCAGDQKFEIVGPDGCFWKASNWSMIQNKRMFVAVKTDTKIE